MVRHVVRIFKTYDSELQGQEEAGHAQRMSVLFTCSTAVKFVYALNKLPLNYHLVIKDSAHSNYIRKISNPTIEETSATNPKYQPL